MLSEAATAVLKSLVEEGLERRRRRFVRQQHSLDELHRRAEAQGQEPVAAAQELIDAGLLERVRGLFGGLETVSYRLRDLDVARAYSEETTVKAPGPKTRPSALAESVA